MTREELIQFVDSELDGTLTFVASEENGAPEVAWGDTFFFYDPDRTTEPEKRLPYATIVINDYPGFDDASNLSRDGVYRVNVWVSRETFERGASGAGDSNIDFTALDSVIPHPVYGKQSWVSVLNPGPATEFKVKALLSEAHANDKVRYEKRRAKRG